MTLAPGDALLQVIDPEVERGRQVREVLAACGFPARSLPRVEQLEDLPEALSFVLAFDRGDELSDHNVRTCIARGHGVILYSNALYQPRVVELLVRGAVGYLPWPFECDDLRRAVQTAENLGRKRVAYLAREARALDLLERLSPREKQVLACWTSGAKSKEIAEELGISHRTVEVHRAKVLSKLEVNGALAVRMAAYAGLERHQA